MFLVAWLRSALTMKYYRITRCAIVFFINAYQDLLINNVVILNGNIAYISIFFNIFQFYGLIKVYCQALTAFPSFFDAYLLFNIFITP